MMNAYRRSLTLLAGALLLAATTVAALAAHYAHDGSRAAATFSDRSHRVETVVEEPTTCREALSGTGVHLPAAPAQGRQA